MTKMGSSRGGQCTSLGGSLSECEEMGMGGV